MAEVTVSNADVYQTASYAFSQSVSGVYQKESTVQVAFDVGGSNYGGLTQDILIYSSDAGSAWDKFYSSSFTIGNTTTTKNFNALLPLDSDTIKFEVSGNVQKIGSQASGSENIFQEVNIQYDNVTMTVTEPRVEIKQDGILIYQSPSRYILMSKTEGLLIKGGDVEADNVSANTQLTVDQDAYVGNKLYVDQIITFSTNSVVFPDNNVGIGTDITTARLTIKESSYTSGNSQSAQPVLSVVGGAPTSGYSLSTAGTGSYGEIILGAGSSGKNYFNIQGGLGGYFYFTMGAGGEGGDGINPYDPGVGGQGGYFRVTSGFGGKGGDSDESAVPGGDGGGAGPILIIGNKGGQGGYSDYNGATDGGSGGYGGLIYLTPGPGGEGGRGLGSADDGPVGLSGSVLIADENDANWTDAQRATYRLGVFGGGMYVETGSIRLVDGSVYAENSVGIGTTKTIADLHILGGVVSASLKLFPNRVSTTDAGGADIWMYDNNTTSYGVRLYYDASPNSLQIISKRLANNYLIMDMKNTSGTPAVGIGTTTWTGGHVLYVAGSIGASGTITPSTPSDIRYKKNIYQLKNPLQTVIQIRGVEFDWKDDIPQDIPFEGHDVGLIADEVEKVYPDGVIEMGTDEKYKGIRYDRFIPLLIEAIKEQNEKIEVLEKKVKELENGK